MKIEGSRKGKRLFMWGNGGEDDGDYVHRICTIETGKGGDNRDRRLGGNFIQNLQRDYIHPPIIILSKQRFMN
jgi:hypothetical protein